VRFDKLALLRSTGRSRLWFVLSTVFHVLAIAGLILLFRPHPPRTITYIDLGGPEEQMPAYQGPANGGPAGGRTPAARPRQAPAILEAPTVAVGVPLAKDTVTVVLSNGEEDTDTLPADTHRQLGPQFGDGRLWVRPGEAAAGRVPARNAVDSMPMHVARIDSALAEKIRSYIDTVPPDSFAIRAAPKWTTQIAGKTWGIDGKWIYLGGMKIPTAVLALLPLPQQAAGSYDLAQREARLEAMRRDIIEAARRAADAVEFKKYVKELRERKEAEHRQREEPQPPPPVVNPKAKPDSTKAPPPPVRPTT
jgi:hypothetical protein